MGNSVRFPRKYAKFRRRQNRCLPLNRLTVMTRSRSSRRRRSSLSRRLGNQNIFLSKWREHQISRLLRKVYFRLLVDDTRYLSYLDYAEQHDPGHFYSVRTTPRNNQYTSTLLFIFGLLSKLKKWAAQCRPFHSIAAS